MEITLLKITLKEKTLAIFILLTLSVIIVMSGVYYYLLIRDIRRFSRDQINVAMEMILDDTVSQVKRITPRIESFINERLLVNISLLYDGLKQLETLDAAQDSEYLTRLQGVIPIASSTISDIGKFLPVLGANEFVVYDKDRKLIAAYRHLEDQDVLGLYLHQLHKGTFIPLRTNEDVSATWNWMGIQDIPKNPLPEEVSPEYEGEIPDTTIATLGKLGKIATLQLIIPMLRGAESQGVCVVHVAVKQHQEISAASNEQSVGAEHVNTAMQQLDQVTQQNSGTSEGIAATAVELAAQARQLQQTMAFFTIHSPTAFRVGAGAQPPETLRSMESDIQVVKDDAGDRGRKQAASDVRYRLALNHKEARGLVIRISCINTINFFRRKFMGKC